MNIENMEGQLRLINVLKKLAVRSTSKDDFSGLLQNTLYELTDFYNAKYAFVGELLPCGTRVRTLAVMADGQIADNFEYDLEGTPCQDILDLKMELITDKASRLYPNDQILLDMGVESYFGSPLKNTDGEIFGLVSVMNTEPMELDLWSEPLLGIYSSRLSIEFERLASEQVLEKSEREQSKLSSKVESSETQLRTLIKTLPDLVWLKDAEGVYMSCNPKFERFFGYKESEIIGKTDYDFVDKVLAGFFRKQDEKAMSAGKPTMNEEEVTYADDGHIELLETIKTPMYASDGTLVGVLGVGRDITKRRQTEELLRHTQKMDALGRLTGGVAHDYNNMLGVVLGYAELLQDKFAGKSNEHHYIEQIIHAGQRGSKLTNKLLMFSKHQPTEAEKLNINTLLEEEEHMLEKTLTARINLDLRLDNKLWSVYFDKSDFESAILNMSINSSHAIENAGDFRIETNNQSINPHLAEKLGINAGDYVRVRIADSGCGIDESDIENIFDPFYSTKGDSGTGLGLSQVYGFVRGCGGAITVESNLGQGTEFTMYFPRYEGSDTLKDNVEVTGNVDLSGTESVLVVDDEPALLNLTCEILSQNGYDVHHAERAKEALITLGEKHIDIVISDIIMPDMDGYKLAALVSEKYPSIKIQLASGFTDDRHINNTNESLHANLLSKPYQAVTLLKRVRALLDEDIA